MENTVTVGTSHFVCVRAAMRYYAPYEGLTLNSRTEKHMEAIVNRKLEAGEIHIGRPVLRSSESVTTNDEGRYVVTSHIQNQEAR